MPEDGESDDTDDGDEERAEGPQLSDCRRALTESVMDTLLSSF